MFYQKFFLLVIFPKGYFHPQRMVIYAIEAGCKAILFPVYGRKTPAFALFLLLLGKRLPQHGEISEDKNRKKERDNQFGGYK